MDFFNSNEDKPGDSLGAITDFELEISELCESQVNLNEQFIPFTTALYVLSDQ